MADYKELLRRAISALPENNGAARRAVYEKARTALVGQLRAIDPPLAARDITQHRLQLEDCIRQVEQEASEAVISLGRDRDHGATSPSRPTISAATGTRPPGPTVSPPSTITSLVPPPTTPVTGATLAAETPPDRPVSSLAARPEPRLEPMAQPAPDTPPVAAAEPAPLAPHQGSEVVSIEDIIQAADAGETEPAAMEPEPAPAPAPTVTAAAPVVTRIDPGLRMPTFQAPREARTSMSSGNAAIAQRLDPEPSAVDRATAAVAPVSSTPPVPVEAALSSVREVELEDDEDTREAQGAIERAIETLDREARGEPTPTLPDLIIPTGTTLPSEAARIDDPAFGGRAQRRGAGLTIFLSVFVLLLAGAGGAGYWAVHEGYIDLDQMFGRSQIVETAQAPAPVADPATPTMDTAAQTAAAGTEEDPAGPGNTATSSTTEPTTALQGLEAEDRLEPTPTPVQPTGTESVLPSLNSTETKSEERLSNEETSIAATPADDPGASVDPSVLAGNQSLLLEASADGRSSAVPFSGTVDWTEGVDEIGLPTLVAQASIPARNLGVTITIRKNSDPSLPASHLMEVNFDVPDTFLGGSISSLPGVLLKNEELVPGTPLSGASARVVGNSFLFALSAAEDDAVNNLNLLRTRRWLDLAIVYGTGRNAILTLEKDQDTQDLFEKVFTAWAG